MGNSHSFTENYIEQYLENSKKNSYKDLIQTDEETVVVFNDDLANANLDGMMPISSDFADRSGRAYTYEEYISFTPERQEECRLRYTYLPTFHTIINGTTGSGKTTGLIQPWIRAMSAQKDKPNFCITDPKGELFNSEAPNLREQDYDVFVLNLKDPMHSDRANLLLDLYDLEEEIVKANEGFEKSLLKAERDSQVHQFAKSMIPIKNSRDPSWESGAQDLLKGILYAMLENVEREDSGFTRDMMTLSTVERYYIELKKAFIGVDSNSNTTSENHPLVKDLSEKTRNFMTQAIDNANNTKRNFFETFSGKMNDWFSGHISTLLTGNTINVDNESGRPFAIFLITRDYDDSDYECAALFIHAIYQKLIMRAEKNENLKNERATHFFLDEFGNIPPIRNFSAKIATSRSRGIFFHLVVQSYKQIDIVYDEKTAFSIINNCNSKIFLGAECYETKKYFSDLCGKHAIPTLASLYNENDYSLVEVPVVPLSQLDLIKPGEMYIKRVFKPVFISNFVRSYQAAETGIYKNFGGGLASELPCCDKFFDDPEYTFVPKSGNEQSRRRNDIFDW